MLIQPALTFRPEVHGHRGCRGLRPENTIPAFLHAVALGVDVLEMDVVVSADNQVVVSHESWLNPHICLDPTGQPLVDAAPAQFNLYQMPYRVIRQCNCGLRRHPDFPEQQLVSAHKPLLSEVLTAVTAASKHRATPIRYSIEIKSTPEGDGVFHPDPAMFLRLVLTELSAAQVVPSTTILSFDARILQLTHHVEPDIATCLLVEAYQPWLANLNTLGFVPTAFGPDFRTVTLAAVTELRLAFPRLRLVPWTVNTLADMRALTSLQVDGITTDYPDVLIALFHSPF
ncbi:glycerophosphodiester phosphodiesterase family protein [Hymenobacter rubidus]|uniref:glycerophosphodiester phosphodiesterase family protein n=1 Tax=Hymenobacter rubidus TaxID=1441626 RepID=UPI00191EB857|nr:glycerophosphodiester phosphodiesterase family protein [Hymenobacter rubidus]